VRITFRTFLSSFAIANGFARRVHEMGVFVNRRMLFKTLRRRKDSVQWRTLGDDRLDSGLSDSQ
jgi:hypothetical protein